MKVNQENFCKLPLPGPKNAERRPSSSRAVGDAAGGAEGGGEGAAPSLTS